MGVDEGEVAGVDLVLGDGIAGVGIAGPIEAGAGDGDVGVAEGDAVGGAEELVNLKAPAVVLGGGAAGPDGVVAIDIGEAIGTEPADELGGRAGVKGKRVLRIFWAMGFLARRPLRSLLGITGRWAVGSTSPMGKPWAFKS